MKILNIVDLAIAVKELKDSERKIVLCHGVFDLVHLGHIRHLKAAKELGDILIVSLTADAWVGKGPGRPVFNQVQRAEFMSSLSCVDFVTINDAERATDIILKIQPDIYAKGQDYSSDDKDLTGGITEERTAIESVGGRLICTNEITFSSSSLINEYLSIYPEEAASYLSRFRKYHTPKEIINILDSFRDLKVLVVGEAIIDEYIYCRVLGKPAKASVLSVQTTGRERFLGGSLAIANHIANFVDEVCVVTYAELEYMGMKPNVRVCKYNAERFAVMKTRFLDEDFHYKLFEYTNAPIAPLPDRTISQIEDDYREMWEEFDIVIVADYGHDLLTDSLVRVIVENNKFLAVNTQTNSLNQGFNLITKYPRADFICIDRPELRLAVSDRYGSLHHLLLKLRNLVDVRTLVLTCGPEGSIVNIGHYMDETPALSDYVVDTMGAGDAYFAIASLCALKGVSPEILGFIGNAVGALSVSTLGHRKSIEYIDLCKYITRLLK